MERSSFFNAILDSEGTPDRTYLAEDYAKYFASFIANGVFPNPSTGLQVMANGDMTVTIRRGKAWINGYYYENTDDYTLSVDVADGVLSRLDRVVLKLDFLNRTIKAYVKKGQFASSPVAPNLQRDSDAYEIALADVKINKGSIKIVQSNVTDLRLNKDLCGIVHGTVEQVDTTTLYNQIQSDLSQFKGVSEADFSNWSAEQKETLKQFISKSELNYNDWSDEQKQLFNAWFDSVRNTLDEDTAGNLLNLINGKAEKSVIVPYSLLATKWIGTKAPYTYKVENEKITAVSNQELLPSDKITAKELLALQSANLTDIGQGNGYFMLQANGVKPSIDIPIRLIFRGDM